MPFTPEELEAMRLADEEIDREFAERYVADQVDKEISRWIDELAYLESLDHKAAAKFKRQKKYSAAYRAEHKEEIAAYQAAYYAEHMKDPSNRLRYNEYMREYMRAYRKGIRRKANDAARHIQSAAETLDKKIPSQVSHTCEGEDRPQTNQIYLHLTGGEPKCQ